MEAKVICIMCPNGCELTVKKENENITVTGNACIRGERYGKQEVTAPKRIVTTLLKLTNGKIVSVKTSTEIDKSLVQEVVNEVNKLKLASVKQGDVVIENVLGQTGCNVVVTGAN